MALQIKTPSPFSSKPVSSQSSIPALFHPRQIQIHRQIRKFRRRFRAFAFKIAGETAGLSSSASSPPGIILAEGIILAASGFLAEEWDEFFTPTVVLFIAGMVVYGVLEVSAK